MGQNIRHLPEGQDFTALDFASEKNFGFSGSADEHQSNPKSGRQESGPVGGTAGMAKGGAMKMPGAHPQGHSVMRVHHDPATGAVVHTHQHGGMTMHHPNGSITHHGADGQPAGPMGAGAGGPGEGTYVSQMAPPGPSPSPDAMDDSGGDGAITAMAKGGRTRIPASEKPKGSRGHTPINSARMDSEPSNRPPRNPSRNPSPRNEMPGGQMPYGVQPSAESDKPVPQLARGGRMRDYE